MSRFFVSGVVVAALVAVLTPTPASSVTYDKLAYLTFSAQVQVPGATLSAGTYRFHLTNPETSRNVLQVLSNDGSIVYAMFHTMSDFRATVTEEATVTFIETPAGVPPALRSLFYGGESGGYEFVYPKGGPNMIAEVIAQPEITYTWLPAPIEPKAVEPGYAVEPEVLALEPFVAAKPELLAQAVPAAAPVQQPAPAELPHTAGPLPLVAAGGLTSLIVGLGLGLLRRRVG
jgi:hypothetical protein